MNPTPSFSLSTVVSAADLAMVYPWPQGRSWLRAMMVTSLDGAATGPDGLSGSISSPADQRVFAETRRLADAVLIGSGTLIIERYRPLVAKPEDREERLSQQQAEAPQLVIVSASLRLPLQETVFAQSTVRPVVVTTQAVDDRLLDETRQVADVVQLRGDRAGAIDLLKALRLRGLERIVCEGGPHLLSTLAAADVVDEADISIAPLIVGGGQIPTGSPTAMRWFDLVGVMVDEGFLFNRYVHMRHRELVS